MTSLSKAFLFWTPRVLAMLYIVFLSLFALDVFTETATLSQTLVALSIHLIPSFILIVGLILAWRWEWIGAAFYGCAGLLYIVFALSRHLPLAIKLNWILVIAGPAFAVAALFLADWLKRGELHAAHA